MSLARDFHNYYGNCYVGYRITRGGRNYPFFVTAVRTGRNFREGDYSEEAIQALRFSGYYVNDEGRHDVEATLSSGKIDLEMPELGYIVRNNRPVWLSFRPQRSMRKGLCGRRVDGLGGNGNITDEVALQIYDAAENKPDPLARHFFVHEGNLLYKGRKVGNVDGNEYKVFIPYRYLSHFVRKTFGDDVDVQFVEEQENA